MTEATALAAAPIAPDPSVTMGFSNAASFDLIYRTSKVFAASTMVPAAYQAVVAKGYGNNITYEQNPAAHANCAIALDMATRMDANPLMVMQNLHIIEGRPSWSSQFIIAAINNCGRFAPLRFELQWLDEVDATYSTFEWVEPEGGGRAKKVEKKHAIKLRNARCVAWTVERGTQIPSFGLEDLKAHGGVYGCCLHFGIPLLESPPVTMEMAVNEGWYGKNGSKWRSMPDLMLRYRAAAFFGRLYAPELLMGLPTADETRDVIDVERQADGTYAVPGQPAGPSEPPPPAAEAGTRKPRAPRAKEATDVKSTETAGAAEPTPSPAPAEAPAATRPATKAEPKREVIDASTGEIFNVADAGQAVQDNSFEPLDESQRNFIVGKMELAALGSNDFEKKFGKPLEQMSFETFAQIIAWINNPFD